MRNRVFLKDLREKSIDELVGEVSKLRLASYSMNSDRADKKYSSDASLFHKNRRDIARVLTVLNEKIRFEML